MQNAANAGARETIVRAVVTRADGTREDLGIVSYWHVSPLMRALFRIRRFLRLI